MIRKSLPFLMKNVTQTSIRPLSSFDLNRSSATSSTLLQSSFTPLNLPNRTLFGMKKDKLGGENSSKAKKQQQAEAEAKTQEEPMPEQGPPKAEEASASPEANNTASAESAETETASSEEVAALKLKIEEYEKELKTKDDVILKERWDDFVGIVF